MKVSLLVTEIKTDPYKFPSGMAVAIGVHGPQELYVIINKNN